MAEIINAFPHMSEMASNLSNHINKDINDELTSLQLAAQRAQQKLFWQTLLLVPMTLAVVGVFTYLFGRPIRAIDRAHQRTRPRHVFPADRNQRAGRFGAPRSPARMAARQIVGVGAGKESIPATYVA